jgi:ABC-type transporter Mla maintaining outer membrane lipid asymmetry ATPase subunit MlaF
MPERIPPEPHARPPSGPIYPALQMIDADIGSLKNTDIVVLHEVNWRVAVGDYWAIGGLQASGKSDLLSTAAGLMPPLKGTHLVFGQPVQAGYEPDQLPARLRVGMVFEGGRLLHHLTVAENVSLPLRYHTRTPLAESLVRSEALLDFVGLKQYAESLPGALSRNWQQRVGLARALALTPEILLVDDVATRLDPREAGWWLDILDTLAAGHELLDNRRMTLVATAADLRPFRNRARQFATVHEKRFIPFDQPLETILSTNAHLRELLGITD